MLFLRLFLILFLFVPTALTAQEPLEFGWVYVLDGYNDVTIEDMVMDQKGNTYVGVNRTSRLEIPQLGIEHPAPGHVGRTIIKLDKEGKAKWALSLKSAFDGRINAMALAPNGDLIVSGFCDGESIFTSTDKQTTTLGRKKEKNEYHQPQFLYIVRYSPKGVLQWAKMYSNIFGQASGLAVNSKGEIYWSFYKSGTMLERNQTRAELTASPDKENRAMLWKLNAKGEKIKAMPLAYVSDFQRDLPELLIDHEDNLIAFGGFKGEIILDAETKLTNDAYYDSKDAYVVKYNADDELLWAQQLSGRNHQFISTASLDKKGNILLTGDYSMECNFTRGVQSLRQSGYEWKSGSSFFLAELNPDGFLNFVKFHKQKGYGSSCLGHSAIRDINGTIHATGTFKDTLNFDTDLPFIYEHPRASAVSFISVWDDDKIKQLSRMIPEPYGHSRTPHFVGNGEHLALGGMYYSSKPVAIIQPSGKKFILTTNEYGNSAFILGGKIEKKEQTTAEQKEEEEEQCDHLCELQNMLECVSPERMEDENLWVPIAGNEPNETTTETEETTTQEGTTESSSSLGTVDTSENTGFEYLESKPEDGCGVRLKNCVAKVYPNPTRDKFTLQMEGFEGEVRIDFISESGALIYSETTIMDPETVQFEYNISEVARGIYFVSITQGGLRKALKLVKS